ncbi:MAG: glycosyltransferase family 39 protein [Bacteroidetes bacterium]|nr:glycosyltransferase family 39 protein [Bacteroidota bacterium]
MAFLFIGSLILGLFIAKLDPFINLWDEQFHALVAKNLISKPLKPILIENPVFAFNNSHWSYLTIWLHKQPLFLWQMALSIKIFGLTEVGIRFPSILMHALVIFFIYRIGEIFVSKKIGYYAALFFTCAYFPLEYITGFYATDHNDISFFFYAFSSIWALTEYYVSKKTIFLILIALFSGAAILCKWLVGLLVYAVWVLLIFSNRKKNNLFKETTQLLFSFIICLLIFLPWQIYMYIHYPNEYLAEMAFNSRHISEALEGHGGGYFYYYEALYEQFGEGALIPPTLIICFILLIVLIKNRDHKMILISCSVMIYLFFTFVKTKMYGYVFVIFPFFIFGLAFVYDRFIEKINGYFKNSFIKATITTITILILLIFLFNSGKIYKHHSNFEHGRYVSRLIDVREKQLFLSLKERFGGKKCLIFNCNTSLQSHILAILYTDYPSFDYVLDTEQLTKAKAQNYTLLCIDDGKLSEEIIKDKSIIKIKFKPI